MLLMFATGTSFMVLVHILKLEYNYYSVYIVNSIKKESFRIHKNYIA